ncbi:MAG: SUMF1/EgtB/PvdO family nonheme iron enzyme [Acidobacteriota bacterium]
MNKNITKFVILLSSVFYLFPILKGVENKVKKELLGKEILINGGEYFLGDDKEFDNSPERKKAFPSFFIEIHPVTNIQYSEFLKQSGYKLKGNFKTDEAVEAPFLPATGLTFRDAEAYAGFYNKRLPTEWEWEIAARSLKKENIYVHGKVSGKEDGNFLASRKYKKTDVFLNKPNELGLYSMEGNVYEWCDSNYEKKYLTGNNKEEVGLKVLRGGSWTNQHFDIKTTVRTPFPENKQLDWLGFRCVRDQKKGK